ncbi:MAG: hypothetical protein ACOC0W_04200, partial [Desulfosalsimonas sp.]
MSIAARIKQFTHDSLEAYDANNGLSPDPYHDRPCFHPMAEGKFMQAGACMKRSASNSYNRRLFRNA